jgi:hypothetical protein
MGKTPDNGRFSPEETQRRMEAALRGARVAGPQHRESVVPKKAKAKRKGNIDWQLPGGNPKAKR